MSEEKAFLIRFTQPFGLELYRDSIVVLADSEENAKRFVYGGADGDVSYQIKEVPLMRQAQTSDGKSSMSLEDCMREDLQELLGAKCKIFHGDNIRTIGVIKKILRATVIMDEKGAECFVPFGHIVAINILERARKDEK